jgi:Resolvase, N terminal domain
VAIYARVSSADQKADLERQLGRLAEFASRERLMVVRSVSEIGSGLNGHRRQDHAAAIRSRGADYWCRLLWSSIAIGSWPTICPWLGSLKLGGQAQKHCFRPERCGKLHADRQTVGRPVQRHAHGWRAATVK